MRIASLFLLALTVCACDAAGPSNDGPLAFGIISGDQQHARAGDEKLLKPVVGKLVRKPGGGITFHVVTPAYAQGTIVTGSPVPGAVVCAVADSTGGMVPFVPCTNTDSAGLATFFFSPGTRAGMPCSEIRGTLDGQPAVFDTACAVVGPGPLAAWQDGAADGHDHVHVVTPGETVRLDTFPLIGRDQWMNPIGRDSIVTESIRWKWYRFRTGDGGTVLPMSPPADVSTGWTTTVPDSIASWNSCEWCTYDAASAILVAWIGGDARSAIFFDVD